MDRRNGDSEEGGGGLVPFAPKRAETVGAPSSGETPRHTGGETTGLTAAKRHLSSQHPSNSQDGEGRNRSSRRKGRGREKGPYRA